MAEIFGTSGNDSRIGTEDADIMRLLLGDDEAFGRAGDDWIAGGPGNDRLFGEEGADAIRGGTGNDALDGGPDNDTLIGGRGDDGLTGGDGADAFVIDPGAGNDTLLDFAGDGDTILLAGFDDLNDFAQLELEQTGDDALLRLAEDQEVRITGTQVADLDASDFAFGPLPIEFFGAGPGSGGGFGPGTGDCLL